MSADLEVRKCEQCGRQYSNTCNASLRNWKTRRFCGNRCKMIARHGLKPSRAVSFVCRQCGTSVKSYRSQSFFVFCSRKCHALGQRKHSAQRFNGVDYLLSSKGYYVSKGGDRMHRDVWEFHNGPIPDKHVIHHIDHSRSNNAIGNLMCVTYSEHQLIHRAARRRLNEQPRTQA